MIRAMTFDVFGTLLDWRGTIISEVERLAPGLMENPRDFANHWSKCYGDFVNAANGWQNLDLLLASAFHRIAPLYGVGKLPTGVAIELSTTWGRLKPFPGVVDAMKELLPRIYTAALSNASKTMLHDLIESSGLPLRHQFSAETVKRYKPDPAVYWLAKTRLGMNPGEIMMVAAHAFDLNAARRQGFRTALIEREGEPGSRRTWLDHEADFIEPDIPEFVAAFKRSGL